MNRHEKNQKHLKDPVPGDFWHEMLCGVCVVLAVTKADVTICRKKIQCGGDRWTWDLEQSERLSRLEFSDWLSYSTIPDKTWATVSPGAHRWAATIIKNNEWTVLIKG